MNRLRHNLIVILIVYWLSSLIPLFLLPVDTEYYVVMGVGFTEAIIIVYLFSLWISYTEK